jgi:hypothetical protein
MPTPASLTFLHLHGISPATYSKLFKPARISKKSSTAIDLELAPGVKLVMH